MKKRISLRALVFSVTATLVFAGFTAVSSQNKPEVPVTAAADGLQFFNGNLEQGLLAAKAGNKKVFVVLHASWCPACKKMKKKVIPEKALGDVYNAGFINVAVDFDSEEGKTVREKYKLTGTPSFVYLDAAGNLLHQASGFKSTEDLLALAKDLQK